MDVEKTIEFLLENQAAQQARFDARMEQQSEKLDKRVEQAEKEIAAVRYELRRGIRLSIQEARAERKRRKEEDQKLADVVAETQRSLKQFIDSLKQPRNGHDQA